MFVCEACHEDFDGWHVKPTSRGKCEMCNTYADCFDCHCKRKEKEPIRIIDKIRPVSEEEFREREREISWAHKCHVCGEAKKPAICGDCLARLYPVGAEMIVRDVHEDFPDGEVFSYFPGVVTSVRPATVMTAATVVVEYTPKPEAPEYKMRHFFRPIYDVDVVPMDQKTFLALLAAEMHKARMYKDMAEVMQAEAAVWTQALGKGRSWKDHNGVTHTD